MGQIHLRKKRNLTEKNNPLLRVFLCCVWHSCRSEWHHAPSLRKLSLTKAPLAQNRPEEVQRSTGQQPVTSSHCLTRKSSRTAVKKAPQNMVGAEDAAFERSVEKFIEMSRVNGLSDADIRDTLKPLFKEIRHQILHKVYKMALRVTIVLVIVWLAVFFTPLYFHMRAMGRIGLIKITPYWDWSRLYYETCLVKNSAASSDNLLEPFECTACEDMKGVEVLRQVEWKLVYENHVSQQLPVIVSDGALTWSILRDEDFWFGNISEAYERLYNGTSEMAQPCNFVSNLRLKNGLHGFFKEIYDHPTKPFFAHWENCDKPSIKVLRQFYERPYFASPAIDISYDNWLLVSSLYEAKVFRDLQLDSSLAFVVQIRGFNHFQLNPQQHCSKVCQSFQVDLEEGEILVVTPMFWNIKYQPGENSDNLAFIIQGEVD